MPSQYPQNVVTKTGLAMIAESLATKKNLIFTRVVVGDGDATGRNFNDMSAVISPKMELPVTSGVNEGNGQYLITATLSNSNLDVGFFPREVGLYAKIDGKAEQLYSYTNGGNNVGYVPDKTIPIDSEIYKIRTVIGNATKVIFKFVDSTFVTKGELDLHNNDVNAHDNKFAKYLPLTGGTVSGDIKFANGSWALFSNGNVDSGIRVHTNGTMDMGVSQRGVVSDINLCSVNRPGWYSTSTGNKKIAMIDDIANILTTVDNTSVQSKAPTLALVKTLLGTVGIVAQRLEENGFIKFSNGVIIQWGSIIDNKSDQYTYRTKEIQLPISFTQKWYTIQTTQISYRDNSNDLLDANAAILINKKANNKFTIQMDDYAGGCYWLCIGI